MPNDDETASPDPLEELLADWFAGAMLAARPRPAAEDEFAYAAELDWLADTHARARALAHAQCMRLYTGLERRVVEGRFSHPIAARRSFVRAPALGPRRDRARFELSI